nr:NAD(P)H-binding protein [uncultured Sphingosinicella sp.]
MRIAMIGATGLIGKQVVDRLLAREAEVHAILRRPSGRTGAGWHEHVAPIAEWPQIAANLSAEIAISTLGTTMRAAGSEAAFRAVDHDAVIAFALSAHESGARHMITVSSVGADAGSSNFYLKLKAEVDGELAKIGFDRLDIFRPGLLRGERGGERRLGERLGILVSPVANLFLQGPLDRYAAIGGNVVADAIVTVLSDVAGGRYVHENRAIHRLARR